MKNIHKFNGCLSISDNLIDKIFLYCVELDLLYHFMSQKRIKNHVMHMNECQLHIAGYQQRVKSLRQIFDYSDIL